MGAATANHRPEIDGLRAIAVLPVVLFHAGLGFSGGYVGVDVFFVISGYLVTSIILRDDERFSLATFWERRVRRILPAATVMVLATLIAGWLLLLPAPFAQLGRSAAANSVFFSNVFFYVNGHGYWDTSQVQPLLHTWSLAVEEQFYLLLPLLMLLLRRRPSRRLAALLVLMVASLGLSVYGVHKHPLATFFLLPTRAWELLLGAALAARGELRPRNNRLNQAVSALGLLAILGSAWFYTELTPFPGEAALVPCMGAAAIIATNTGTQTQVGRLLSLKPLKYVGWISYSLYLWHWPLIVLVQYRVSELRVVDRVGIVATSLLLAFVSWKSIEQPVRSKQVLTRRPLLLAGAAASLAVIVAAGSWIARKDGVASRFGPAVLAQLASRADRDFRNELTLEQVKQGRLVELGVRATDTWPELLVWGDSHAMATLHEVDVLCREHGIRCLAATRSATGPLLDLPGNSQFSMGPQAIAYNRAVVELVARQHIHRVMLVARWATYGDYWKQRFQASLQATVRALRESGARVYIFEDVPEPRFDVPTALALGVACGRNLALLTAPREPNDERNAYVKRTFQALSHDAVVLDPEATFCGDRTCRVEQDGNALYFDDHHLTIHGALRLRNVLMPLFETRG